jgi:hypothetical protein
MLGTPCLAAKSSISSLSRKPSTFGGDAGTEVVERRGYGHGVAFGIDDGIVSGVLGFANG